MNVGGGEAADQLVRMYLSYSDTVIRLGGSLLKNLFALILALAKDHKRVSGKVNLAKMLKQTRDIRQFPMTQEQFKKFKKLAGKYKLLYSTIRDKDEHGKLINVILPVTELDRANTILQKILYEEPVPQTPEPDVPERENPEREMRQHDDPEHEAPQQDDPEREAPQQENPEREAPQQDNPEREAAQQDDPEHEAPQLDNPQHEAPQQDNPEREVPQGEAPQRDPRQDPMHSQQPSVQDTAAPEQEPSRNQDAPADRQPGEQHGRDRTRDPRQPVPPKKDSRSKQGSSDTRTSSSTSKEVGDTRTTSERPSVEERLKAFRSQLASGEERVSTRDKTKVRTRNRTK